MATLQQWHKPGSVFWLKVGGVTGIFLFVQGFVLLTTGQGWAKFWVMQPLETWQYWDARIYADLSVQFACTPFYPLWPRLLNWLIAPGSTTQALKFAIPFSEGLFLLSIPFALWAFERLIPQRSLAFLAFCLFVLGPNAIFQAIGYTESLYSLLSLGLLLLIHQIDQQKLRFNWQSLGLYSHLVGVTVLLNLTRPVLVQTLWAIAVLLGLTLYRCRSVFSSAPTPSTRDSLLKAGLVATALGLGSFLGYSLYGTYCWQTMGSFWGPFQAQVGWGRTLALRPWLLLFPRSLLMDLHGLYLPVLLLLGLGWLSLMGRTKRQTLSLPRQPAWYLCLIHPGLFALVLTGLQRLAPAQLHTITLPRQGASLRVLQNFAVQYAIAFTAAHSLINFFANSGYLYSTARHVFGGPYIYVGIGAFLAAIAATQLRRLAWAIALIGLGLLAQQWHSYAFDGWLG